MLHNSRRIFQLVGADEISRAAAAAWVVGEVGVTGSVMQYIMAEDPPKGKESGQNAEVRSLFTDQ